MGQIIMHIDVNSAFLSWTAAYEQQMGIDRDIRTVPSVIGGNEQNRHGIVLAKSTPAKKFKIQTGMSLMEARQLCPNLLVIPPNYRVYVRASKTLREYLMKFTPDVQPFSIDECFLKFTDLKREEAAELAYKIKDGVKEKFGYTVNIGVSENKLLAKQAGDLEKPDKCHTIFPDEIKEKLWVLPVEDLFMVGRRTKPKLNRWGIYTIGDLAASDYNFISTMLKSHGRMIYNYAWGRDDSVFKEKSPIKSVGNSSTLKFNVDNRETAHAILLSLTEMTALRLREANMNCRVVSVSIKDKDFGYEAKQRKLMYFTDCTRDIYQNICSLFDELWDRRPIRQLGVSVSDLEFSHIKQTNIFQDELSIKNEILDKAVDKIRVKYGDEAVIRGVFANSDLSPILGGYPDDEYPGMGSIL
ncbi:DNA polymerase Y family protein [Sedimentibacter saalensis]|uniref:DNA polymerase IV n=1 Tax=Sedimentibacter saalensis TaxID=130788 RepID=A0A562J4W6_9FIRM|nr:DNA polymerase IV [Sedimentibacter saalensis]TWH78113.1 DNA polymerase-4 [Sedimentibacter saalensis]